MAVIDSLVATLSFDFDGKNLEKFNKGMKDAGKAIAVVAAGAATAGAAIFAFTSKIAEQNDEIGKLSQKIGITAQTINELGYVAQLNGGSVDGMSSSLENLSKTASEAAKGMGGGVEAFGMLGVSVTDASGKIKSTDALLLDVADSIAELGSQSEKLELLSKVGIDSSLLLTLEQGSQAIRRQQEEVKALGFILDDDATQAAANFNDEMLRVGTVVKGVASAVGTKLMKIITPMIQEFIRWFKANKEIIKQNLNAFFETTIKIINTFFNIARRVINVVMQIVNAMGGLKVALIAVGTAIMAVNARALMLPAIVVAVGAAIFLLIEDLAAFARGADSQLGALAERFPALEIFLRGLLKVLGMVADGWNLIFTQGGRALDGLILLIKDVGATIYNYIIASINQAIDLLNKIPGIDIKNVQEVQTTGSLNYATGGMIGSKANYNNTNNVTVNIDGGNPEAVKKAVSEALGTEFKTTELNMSTPTRY